jgi:hypothetical protein
MAEVNAELIFEILSDFGDFVLRRVEKELGP